MEKPGVGRPWVLSAAPQLPEVLKPREQSGLGLFSLFFRASLLQTPPSPPCIRRALWPSALSRKRGSQAPYLFLYWGGFTSPKPHAVVCGEAPGKQTVLRGDSEGEIETEGQTGNTGEEGQGDRGTEGGNSFPSPVSVSVTLDSHRPLPDPQWSPSRRGLRRSDCRGMTSRF